VQITKVVGFIFRTQQKWFGSFLIFLRISRNFTRCWIELQRNLDRVLTTMPWNFARNTLARFESKQLGPWRGRAARARVAPASRWRCRPGKRPGTTRSSPTGCRVPELGRRGGRRRGSAAAGGGTHGGWRFRRCEGNVVQRVAAQASVATREQARGVGRTGGRAGR
jgi:hypothetical protein